jgi:ABC-2 type transport system permease protein
MKKYFQRAGFEIRVSMRSSSTLIFSMLLPIFLLVIFGSVLHSKVQHTSVTFSQYFVAGLLASGLLYAGFQLLAIAIPEERSTGGLKRLAGTPMSPGVYLFGKLAVVLFIYLFQVVFLLGIGHFAYHVSLPGSGTAWLTFAWVSVLGLVSCSLLGIALSARSRDARGASSMTTPVVLFFQFTSGVFFVYGQLPSWMKQIAALFPLKWLAQGMRSVFLPATFAHAEPSHSFELGKVALVLGLWTLLAALLARRSFRWATRT